MHYFNTQYNQTPFAIRTQYNYAYFPISYDNRIRVLVILRSLLLVPIISNSITKANAVITTKSHSALYFGLFDERINEVVPLYPKGQCGNEQAISYNEWGIREVRAKPEFRRRSAAPQPSYTLLCVVNKRRIY